MSLIIRVTLLAILATVCSDAEAQRRRGGARWAQMEAQSLAAGFKGVTTDGKAVSGLFEIRATGVSTELIIKAAKGFLNGLTDKQAIKVSFEEKRGTNNRLELFRDNEVVPYEGIKASELN
ncbi:MAG: hypothetical protein CMO80_17900 [Verrucomicrobiales bacterium]|nr:hypothetical protein [Verrucomicrobiales bacterium]|tara:strand:+ start:3821 stop:4183 length:363 start_codon:yes stop_codon:yes gene_type:complete